MSPSTCLLACPAYILLRLPLLLVVAACHCVPGPAHVCILRYYASYSNEFEYNFFLVSCRMACLGARGLSFGRSGCLVSTMPCSWCTLHANMLHTGYGIKQGVVAPMFRERQRCRTLQWLGGEGMARLWLLAYIVTMVAVTNSLSYHQPRAVASL